MDDNIARLAELLQAQGDGKRPKQTDVLIGLANAAVLFHSPAPDCDALADIIINGHRETHRIRGQGFRQWLRHQFFRKTKTGANSDALQVATETIAAKATFEGDEHEVHCRIAGQGDAIYIDLGDKDWKAIRVTNAGWDIIADFPVRFQRAPSMRPLPAPVRGGSIELRAASATSARAASHCSLPSCSRDCGRNQIIQSRSLLANRVRASLR
jgi:hypothetical protein